MRAKRWAIAALLAVLLTGCVRNEAPGGTANSAAVHMDDQREQLLKKFQGTWINEEDPQFILELKGNVETTGIDQSEQLTESEFEIVEFDAEAKYIVVQGLSQDLNEGPDAEKKAYTSKLQLEGDGNSLLYTYDYLNTNVESHWQKK
ncbi:hypothetical protein [Cohnella terricola]|uniref:Lipoprotein n=1 Tax=Cohnella terricola TaxID=1289167 RepID=A0A559JQ27_9BACL|nr:hypothetical protein [Cohnella terricola]TVY01996.1 hypothetical protein FPZ45_06005 [Cohnella terricola]